MTKATDSVAHGDLNVELDNKEKGEMKDLFQSFNIMTTELRKNQIEISEMERENAWKEMAKQVAHEIKNPLTPMKLAVQQLIISYKDKTKNFDTIFEKVSSTILNQIENLSLIASEFSRFAKMPSLKLETKSISQDYSAITIEGIKQELSVTELKNKDGIHLGLDRIIEVLHKLENLYPDIVKQLILALVFEHLSDADFTDDLSFVCVQKSPGKPGQGLLPEETWS